MKLLLNLPISLGMVQLIQFNTEQSIKIRTKISK